MHAINIMHRDLKSANIFLMEEETLAKLGDMNVSKVTNSLGLNYTQTGTPYYASPEVWRDEPYNNKSDVWSLGCVLYEMIALKPPFQANDMQSLFKKITRGMFPPIPEHFSTEMRQILSIMLQVNPTKRASCSDLISHPIFKKRAYKYYPEVYDTNGKFIIDTQHQSLLLKTIRIPKNFVNVSSRLPKRNYSVVRVDKPDAASSSLRTLNPTPPPHDGSYVDSAAIKYGNAAK
mmetsp:Transcript_22916/g.35252  ORF Transcript_22916/g.35252 Transcript_22916/m.35252 type:complete len:233 (-) Transcript_22916:1467-2165(-)